MSEHNNSQSGIFSDRNLNIFVSIGAAVVIVGAWAKILHLNFAEYTLTAGLWTEAIIFLAYAFKAMKEKTPEHGPVSHGVGGGQEPFKPMLELMNEAGINKESMQKLADSFGKLDQSVSQIKDLSHMQAATSDFTQKTKDASAALDSMKTAYQQAASTASSFSSAAEGSRQFHEQVQVLTKNLGSLNAMYELELKDTNNHLKAMTSFYGNLAQASQALQGSVEDAKKTQEQIAKLSQNLSSLNAVYGNMLAAMQVR